MRIARYWWILAVLVVASGAALAQTPQPMPSRIRAGETALLLIDYQARFFSPEQNGAMQATLAESQMLEKTVAMVKHARSVGMLVVHITEGYSSDYRELDPSTTSGFHRAQMLRQAWKIGGKEAAYYAPLQPGPGEKDLFLPPRAQASAFGGTGLNEILRGRGIRNVAIAGFTTDVCNYATTLAAHDLAYHVYALKDLMTPYNLELSAMMLKTVYPYWSRVVSNDEFSKLIDLGADRPAP